jgi:hypothetical protein
MGSGKADGAAPYPLSRSGLSHPLAEKAQFMPARSILAFIAAQGKR